MTEIVVVGGFASSPEQMNYLAAKVGEQLGKSAMGINFREASQDQDRLASLIEGSNVLTHSGGIKPVVDMIETHGLLPESIISIAPPVREQVRKLMWRGALINLGFRQNDLEQLEQLEQKFSASDELLHHALANFARIPALGAFSSIAEIAHLQQEGVDTTIGLMEHDGLFDNDTRPVTESIRRARGIGSKVLTIPGSHCRFTNDPAGTLAALGYGMAREENADRISPLVTIAA